ncbi:hypothetical protein M0O54_07515 [Acinetobacter lactucae]|uniref:Uncharacterized protein n=1 Tax=Acinetobacter lactucae TaxID=1785128 RepID=A0AB35JX85_9GAMM|nr:hypothetical protein [Acinetobacter lactucae]MDD9319972.1 hypothetical protein [Acinetobacter lactucae]
MPRVASIIPPDSKGSLTLSNGTQVLLDNGEYLQHVNKITLVAEPGQPWKAIIEVHPTNQEQIDALLSDLKVTKRNDAFNRLHEIQEAMQKLQDEKAFLEHEYGSPKTGVWTDGVDYVPKEGTWVLKDNETIIALSVENNGVLEKLHERLNGAKTEIPPATKKVKDIHGVVHSQPDLKGGQDESK